MRKSRRPIVIASRRSRLARAQAQAVGTALGRLHPTIEVRYHWIESEGDRVTDTDLSGIGGKGLFVKAVEEALLRGEADLAVHSLKDVPVTSTPGLVIAAIPVRGDARDCLVARHGVTTVGALHQGAVIGTSGPRRAAQLKRLRPDLIIQPLRGNVETRVQKVLGGEDYDATLMAVAGLQRSGLGEHASCPVDPSIILPAAGQGALALQCRMDDHVTLSRCLPLNDTVTGEAVHAERQIVAGLGGDCHSPIAAYVAPVGEAALEFSIRVRVLGADGEPCLSVEQTSSARGIRRVVKQIVRQLIADGAKNVLRQASAAAAALRGQSPSGSARIRAALGAG